MTIGDFNVIDNALHITEEAIKSAEFPFTLSLSQWIKQQDSLSVYKSLVAPMQVTLESGEDIHLMYGLFLSIPLSYIHDLHDKDIKGVRDLITTKVTNAKLTYDKHVSDYTTTKKIVDMVSGIVYNVTKFHIGEPLVEVI